MLLDFLISLSRKMIYECSICLNLFYVEEEFVEHIQEIHLSDIDDDVLVISEMIAFYSDLKKVRQQEAITQQQVVEAADSEFYCFYGDDGERLIFAKN